jgi:hypothetical protein
VLGRLLDRAVAMRNIEGQHALKLSIELHINMIAFGVRSTPTRR